jgi:hypothetical protein
LGGHKTTYANKGGAVGDRFAALTMTEKRRRFPFYVEANTSIGYNQL